MDRRPPKNLPLKVWHAFSALVIAGVTLGVLYGESMISGIGLFLGMLLLLLAFVPWAVLQLDPRGLKELGIYGNLRDK